MTLHTGEAFLYSCNFCSKTFRSSANMLVQSPRLTVIWLILIVIVFITFCLVGMHIVSEITRKNTKKIAFKSNSKVVKRYQSIDKHLHLTNNKRNSESTIFAKTKKIKRQITITKYAFNFNCLVYDVSYVLYFRVCS